MMREPVEYETKTGCWYVHYDVAGFPGRQVAGPYTRAEVDEQAADIRGYEGVSNVRVEESVADVRGER